MNTFTKPSFSACRCRQAGASLLEVLVAILIMSFGLLALGGLTAASVQYGKLAQYQTTGMQLAIAYADRMRGNVDGFTTGAYDKVIAYSSSATLVAVPTCAVTAACTAAEIAAIDQAQWLNDLKQRLPGGDAFVQRDAVNLQAMNIWLMWTEANLSYGADNSLSTGTSADCPTAAIAGVATAPRCVFFRVSL